MANEHPSLPGALETPMRHAQAPHPPAAPDQATEANRQALVSDPADSYALSKAVLAGLATNSQCTNTRRFFRKGVRAIAVNVMEFDPE